MKILSPNYIKETGWGHYDQPEPTPREIFLSPPNMHHRAIILQRPTKLLNPTHASLFNTLPSDILADIDIFLSILEHHDKFKHVILHFKSISNPILFAIIHDLWTPYLNFGSFRWYKNVQYDWAHRRIMSRDEGYWTHYEYYIKNIEYITQLTPQLLRHHGL